MTCDREEKRQFDVIFGDLTDIPVHGRDTSTWAFVRCSIVLHDVSLTFGDGVLCLAVEIVVALLRAVKDPELYYITLC